MNAEIGLRGHHSDTNPDMGRLDTGFGSEEKRIQKGGAPTALSDAKYPELGVVPPPSTVHWVYCLAAGVQRADWRPA